MTRRDTKLYLDNEDRKLGGVCSGLARYFDVDTTLVRVLFVSLLVFGGGSLLAYLLLWWLLDPAPAGYWDETARTETIDTPAPPVSPPDAEAA